MLTETPSSTFDYSELGFTSPEDLALVRALLLECSGFSGMDSLLRVEPKISQGTRVELAPGFAHIPASLMSFVVAGPGGALGRALMAAASRPFTELTPQVHRPTTRPSRDSDLGAAKLPPELSRISEHSPRPHFDEGIGSDSFEVLISALEDSGFGDSKTAELIRTRKAATKSGGRPQR